MFTRFRHRATMAAAPILAAFAVAGTQPANAQKGTDDIIKRTEAVDAIARQKLESELNELFAQVDRAGQVPALAALKRKREAISSELAISEATRRALLAKIDAKYRAIETGRNVPSRPELGQDASPEKRAAMATERARVAKIAEERADIKRSIDTIDALARSGREEQALKEAQALMKRQPNNPAALAFGENLSMNQRIYEAKVLLAQQRDGYLLAMRNVDKSAIPPKDDIEFDTIRKGYFKEITEKRKPKLTEREKALLKALDKEIDLPIRGKSLEDALQALSDHIKQPILVDKDSLRDVQEQYKFDTNTPVNLELRNVQTRTALKKLLQDHGLTYILKNETIQVVTLEKARQTLTTRVYYLGDLASGVGAFGGGAVVWGPQIDQFQTAQNFQMLVDTIKKIDPFSWREQGGLGTVTFHWPSMSLIIRQTAEFHAKFGGSYGTGR